MPDGSYRLPGSFYSPEHSDVGDSLEGFIRRRFYEQYNIQANPEIYMGAVGGKRGDRYADTRFPRVSHIFGARVDISALEGTELTTIPIFDPDDPTRLSEEILTGNWGFDHNDEIVQPLIHGTLSLLSAKANF